MGFKCKIGLHSWDGCKCTECEQTRNKLHDWNGCKCSKCGETRNEQHDWSKDCEKCSKCGKNSRIEIGSICSNCGKKISSGEYHPSGEYQPFSCSCKKDFKEQHSHDWSKDCEKCFKCGKTREESHTWEGSKCTKCGKILETKSKTQIVIPWDYIRKVPSENDTFFSEHEESLRKIYSQMVGMGHDPILMLVAMDQERWCALLALLYKRRENLFTIPETYTKSNPVFFNNGYCDVYIPPKIDGLEMKSCIFGLEREWLISEFCWVKGIPTMFISLIKADMAPAESFTIVVLASNGMCVKHLQLNTIIPELKTKSKAKISMTSTNEIEMITSMLTKSMNAETFVNAIKKVGYKYKEESFLGVIYESEFSRILLNVKVSIHPSNIATALYLDKNNNKQTYLVENGIRS